MYIDCVCMCACVRYAETYMYIYNYLVWWAWIWDNYSCFRSSILEIHSNKRILCTLPIYNLGKQYLHKLSTPVLKASESTTEHKAFVAKRGISTLLEENLNWDQMHGRQKKLPQNVEGIFLSLWSSQSALIRKEKLPQNVVQVLWLSYHLKKSSIQWEFF